MFKFSKNKFLPYNYEYDANCVWETDMQEKSIPLSILYITACNGYIII